MFADDTNINVPGCTFAQLEQATNSELTTKERFVFVLLWFPKHNLNSAQIFKPNRGIEMDFMRPGKTLQEGKWCFGMSIFFLRFISSAFWAEILSVKSLFWLGKGALFADRLIAFNRGEAFAKTACLCQRSQENWNVRIILKINWYERFLIKNIEWKFVVVHSRCR